MKTFSIPLIVILAIATQGCDRRQVASQAKGTEPDTHEDSPGESDAKDRLGEIESFQSQMGFRGSRKGDIGFIECGMLPGETNGMNEVLGIFKHEQIELALPEDIAHGVGVWSISAEDFDRALRVVERDDLRHRFPQLTFAAREGAQTEKKRD